MNDQHFLQSLNEYIGTLLKEINLDGTCSCKMCMSKRVLLAGLLDMQKAIMSQDKTAHLFAIDNLIDAHDYFVGVSIPNMSQEEKQIKKAVFSKTRDEYVGMRTHWMDTWRDECLQ